MATARFTSQSPRWNFLSLALAGALLGAGLAGCGELDDVTTIKDLRVLAVKAEPAAFIVDLANPGTGTDADWRATFTALVVDPTSTGDAIEVRGLGCPNYLDTITAATGTGTRTCSPTPPDLPEPLKTVLSSVPLTPDGQPASVPPTEGFTYQPPLAFGLTTLQLQNFFSSTKTGVDVIDQAVDYNRTFGLDAIASLSFARAGQTADAIKRVVYWPKLDPALIDGEQKPNQNPVLTDITFYRARNETTGDPEEQILPASPGDLPEVSRSRGDKLYVLPSQAEAETYYFMQKDHEMNNAIVATKAKEYLRYAFFATAGTFSPAERQSELSPFFTSKDGKVHLDSEYNLPKAKDLTAPQEVTIWVVVRDERAGVGWLSKKIRVLP